IFRRNTSFGDNSFYLLYKSRMPKVFARKIYSDTQRLGFKRLFLPLDYLRTGRMQYLNRHRYDQTGALADRDKFVWRHHSALRMVPADKRLKTGQRCIFKAYY